MVLRPLKKRHWFSLLLLITTIYLAWPRSYYIGTHDGRIKFQVPDAIVQAEDCKAFREFAKSKSAPGFIPESVHCPWKENLGPIAYKVINGVEFHIPREYIAFGKYEPDGETMGVHLFFVYPDMRPDRGEEDHSRHINVSISRPWEEWPDPIRFAHIKEKRDWMKDCDSRFPKELGSLASGLIEYDYCWVGNAYILGDPYAPEYFIQCNPLHDPSNPNSSPTPYCNAYVMNYNGLQVEIFFRRSLLPQEQEIRQLVFNKLEQFKLKRR